MHNTIFHRSVHPNHFVRGIVTMEAFSPSSAEDYGLSVNDGRTWSAAQTFHHRVQILGKASVGVWCINRSEISLTGFSIKHDPEKDNPSHTLVQFPKSKSERARRRDAARRFAAIANSEEQLVPLELAP